MSADFPWRWPRAAYVHVPFCAHHCGYCDFAVAAGQDHLQELYLDALEAELMRLGEPQPMRTLFVGGGTPSHLGIRPLERLLRLIRHWLPPREAEESYEWTVEANPESLDADKVDLLAEHGVTRVSLGAQSFHLLGVLERAHDPEAIPRAVERLRGRIARVSLDLIFGVPGQTEREWRSDLACALALAPNHLSTYGLTYEKGTTLWGRRRRGEIRPLEEDAELTLYQTAIDTLEAAGFDHYEISNFARPGQRCRHNEVYWANDAYFGFGVGAARYVEGRRELNTRDLKAYMRRALSGESTTFQSEQLGPEEAARETMAVQLRRAEGIERSAFQRRTGYDLDALAKPALERHVRLGLLEDDGRGVRLTRAGKYVADAVIERLL